MPGTLKAAGALGLLIGIGVPVPVVGTGAAVGLVDFFVGAAIAHIRFGDNSISGQHVYLLSSATTLVLTCSRENYITVFDLLTNSTRRV